MAKFSVVTFGTPDFSRAIKIQKRNSLKFGAHRHIAYDVQSPAVMRALSENTALSPHMRGYAYWIWKPYIILDALDQIETGDYVVYLDAGVAPVANMQPWFEQMQHNVANFFATVAAHPLRKFTKRDCFILMRADMPRFHNAVTPSANMQVYRKDPESTTFLAELKASMRDTRSLTDADNVLGLPNHEGYIEHRHDQSILGLLIAKRGHPVLREPSQYGIWTEEKRRSYFSSVVDAPGLLNEDYPQVLDIHRARNGRNALFYWWWRWNRRRSLAKSGVTGV